MSSYLLKIKFNDQSIIPYYKNHRCAYNNDSGIDIYFSENVIIPPNSLGNIIKTGICMELIDIAKQKEASYMIVSRSSIYNTPLRHSLSVSIIDAGFRGEISFVVDNLSYKEYYVNKGDRLFQVIAPSFEPIKLIIVDELYSGNRVINDFGSSGQNILAKL